MANGQVGWHGNTVPLCIHALNIGIIVLPLGSHPGLLCRIRPGNATDQ